MCERRRNACCGHRNNGYYQPRQGLLRTIFTDVMNHREEKKRLMVQYQSQDVLGKEQSRLSRQTAGVAGWGDEKREVREEPRVYRQSRRIEVEGPPSYREVMKGT